MQALGIAVRGRRGVGDRHRRSAEAVEAGGTYAARRGRPGPRGRGEVDWVIVGGAAAFEGAARWRGGSGRGGGGGGGVGSGGGEEGEAGASHRGHGAEAAREVEKRNREIPRGFDTRFPLWGGKWKSDARKAWRNDSRVYLFWRQQMAWAKKKTL
jgi:hypothetical protein